MLWTAFETVVYGIRGFLNFLYTFKVYGNVSLLGVLVGFIVILFIIDNFVMKAQ